ncbi:hypothetical protein [Lactiplantibacillus plantarum]|uniref:hypothetical protein n=1 Tax=Lactiplantibacillus plantarum TaxID=1590 RepID=UPI001C1FE5C3|nr:hypothetical protein [Lactiplantibacillus plantarum]MBU7472271.1 hypothetical protein [Lactiplantibacillus plantarum]
MVLIPIILYYGGFILIMIGFFLNVHAKAQNISIIRKDAPTKEVERKNRMTFFYQLYSDPELNSRDYDHYNTFWVLSLFLWLILVGACIASIYPMRVYQDASFSMATSVLAILGLVNYLFFSHKRENAFSHLKQEAITKHPEWKKIWLYYPKRSHVQLIAKILVIIGILSMLSTSIAIFFSN